MQAVMLGTPRRAHTRLIAVTLARSLKTAVVRDASIRSLSSVLIANRGEIALRVGRTAAEHGVRVTTLYTDPDAKSQHALSSPFARNLGYPSAYLDGDRIIQIAKSQGCDAIHPGYGFLSENSSFAKKCADAGIVFIGPPADAIEAMGNKSRSKEIMTAAGVPCIPGYHGANQDSDFLRLEAEKIGFPVLLKAVKGGGGKGMRISTSAEDFLDQLASARSEARNSFGDDTMLVEKYITTPRHIEVQIFADQHGNCVALGERDCSIQRRHQKIIEESPAPNLNDVVRKDLWQKAREAALAVAYEGAGTVEFIFDNDTGDFFFMEMNTRLQVEHPVTEMVTGQDLVHWQLQVAEGKTLPLNQEQIEQQIRSLGWAFEARIYAENPDRGFIPDSGTLLHMQLPQTSRWVRVDSGFVQGDEVSSHYDPMIAKLIVLGSTRQEALQKLSRALESYQVAGTMTNIEFLRRICESPDFRAGNVETGYIDKHKHELFARDQTPAEVWAQAAIALNLQESSTWSERTSSPIPHPYAAGFGPGQQSRSFQLAVMSADGQRELEAQRVELTHLSSGKYDVAVGEELFTGVSASLVSPHQVETFFPHMRLTSTVIADGAKLIIFQQGKQFSIRQVIPAWFEAALGIKDVSNSLLAPMPCKILRVEVTEGAHVHRDQPLVVIESMKMETVIRSPQNGTISKILHREGDICKAGTALVEFAVSNGA